MLTGKCAIITGSTSGIGLGIAKILAAAGASIMLNGFGDRQAIDNLKLELEKEFKVTCSFHDADISNPDAVNDLIATSEKTFGKVDILVNNAGIQHVSPIDEFPLEKWNSIIAINLSAAFHTIKAALPIMKKNGFGRIINIASAHGLVASINKCAYVAAKHGIVGLTKVVALETAELNITCNAICPGWVKTPLVEKQIIDRSVKENITVEQATINLLSEKQPSLKFVTTEQIGEMARFLSCEAGSSITGTAIPMDGGWTAR
jgi:3-hydroxybutyrate dehydrogenase